MCGIAGFLANPTRVCVEELIATAAAMADRLVHRGPDDGGVWADVEAGIALGHRRLSILDLSPAGHQPMISRCGRYVMAFNGEIYNHQELRADLEASGLCEWRGHSDTETLLAVIAAKGLKRALQASVGMFALAVWDRDTRTLALARDRMGEKPLYYGWQGDTFLFGSELRALQAHPEFRGEPSRDALSLLVRLNYIPAPHSIYNGVHKLQPGTCLTVGLRDPEVRIEPYWSYVAASQAGELAPFTGSDTEACDALEATLTQSVQAQSLADVPLGALLSGGIDSSTIVALMQAHASRPVKTFTIGFSEAEHDEAAHAARVAKHLGTDHTSLTLSPSHALTLIPDLPRVYDEPFADPSQLPTQLVMQLARQTVTVALSGDGGDELFGGYNRYRAVPAVWRRLGRVPGPVRRGLARSMQSVTTAQWDTMLRPLAPILRIAQPGEKLQKLADRMMYVDGPQDLYFALVSGWMDPTEIVPGAREPESLLSNRSAWPAVGDPVRQMMILDALTFLPDDVLTKVDRAAMAVSLETRAPFLDHRVVEFAATLPPHTKIRSGTGKWLLRQVLNRHIPKALVERPKMGFSVPLDAWLRGPLKEWAESQLEPTALRQQGYFDSATVQRVWAAHLSGRSNGVRLWPVLMFQAWLAHTKSEQRPQTAFTGAERTRSKTDIAQGVAV